MPITILNPRTPVQPRPLAMDTADSDSDSDSSGGADIQGDIAMRAPKRQRQESDDDADEILTPGAVITSNPQWMR